MTREFTKILAFAHEHAGDDPLRLLLQQQHYPDIDLRQVAQQLEGQRQASTKWPTLARCEGYYYPPRLNREQSSSEATARYKARLFAALGGGRLADLTGGMGVDCYFMAQAASQADYYEQDGTLCTIAEHNFAALGQENIRCHKGDSLSPDHELGSYDMIYIDPARRDSHGHKVAAFEDCTPNLLANLDRLRPTCRYLLVKASPMIDLRLAERQLKAVGDIHVVALQGECKEVLFVVNGTETAKEARIHCVDLTGDGTEPRHVLTFTRDEEESALPLFAHEVETYLYEPNAALMKGGCYNSLCGWYGVKKLARKTHLYTSTQQIAEFPGRTFRVLRQLPLNAKEVRHALPDGKAHVVTRNYPLAAADLQKKLRLREGGTLFIVAATLGTRPLGWLCEMV